MPARASASRLAELASSSSRSSVARAAQEGPLRRGTRGRPPAARRPRRRPAAAARRCAGCSSSRAIPAAWTGPLPPNATSVKSRGSRPRWTGHGLDRPDHARVGQLVAAVGGRRSIDRPSGSATSRREDAPRRASASIGIAPSSSPVGIEVAEHEVGVGHGRLRRRPCRSRPDRAGAGAVRTDLAERRRDRARRCCRRRRRPRRGR